MEDRGSTSIKDTPPDIDGDTCYDDSALSGVIDTPRSGLVPHSGTRRLPIGKSLYDCSGDDLIEMSRLATTLILNKVHLTLRNSLSPTTIVRYGMEILIRTPLDV